MRNNIGVLGHEAYNFKCTDPVGWLWNAGWFRSHKSFQN